jgi:SAM-dependent methyltransferase
VTGGGLADGPPGVRLLDDAALEASSVVANCAMNRERQLAGVNSYARELGFNPVEYLLDLPSAGEVSWLDLCCGTGRALIQATGLLQDSACRAVLVGIDLAGIFDPAPQPVAGLDLVPGSVGTWRPDRAFDLITCVHGLHYVGDKLGLLTRASRWLSRDGLLVADLDVASIRLADGRPAGRQLTASLRAAGFSYDTRRRRITCSGRRDARLPYAYLGADDQAGPSYTGQPAVHSYYFRQ